MADARTAEKLLATTAGRAVSALRAAERPGATAPRVTLLKSAGSVLPGELRWAAHVLAFLASVPMRSVEDVPGAARASRIPLSATPF